MTLQRMALLGAAVSGLQPAPNPTFSNVSLLLPASGTNNSTSVVDQSSNNNTFTAFGDFKVTTAVADAFGGNNGIFTLDGSGDYASAPVISAYSLPGDFTIQIYFRLATVAGNQPLICMGRGAVSTIALCAWSLNLASDSMVFFRNTSTETVFSFPFPMTAGEGAWVTLCRIGSSLRMFKNGAQVGSTVTTSVAFNTVNSDPLLIGRMEAGSVGSFRQFNGVIGPIRIAREGLVSGPHAIPSGPFPTS